MNVSCELNVSECDKIVFCDVFTFEMSHLTIKMIP